MFDLTFDVQKPTVFEPRFLILYSLPKTGKSISLMQLPKSLHIDLESGSGFYEGNAIDVPKLSKTLQKHPIAIIRELAAKIKAANIANGGVPVYDFITLDSATILEDYAAVLATQNYKLSAIGKSFTGKNVVTDLPNGAGYALLRDSFDELYTPFIELAGKCFTLVVHTKDNVINKDGKDLTSAELNLTGKSKMITASKADAIGLLYRSKKEKNTNILSFIGGDSNPSVGCRLPYLTNQEFVLSTYEDQKIKTNWETIFPSIK